jgi:hypothetical protein
MQKTRIRKDSHSLYVRAGGYVFRPVPNPMMAPQARAWSNTTFDSGYRYANVTTGFVEGEEAKAAHVAQTQTARVKSLSEPNRKELWYAHGESAEYTDRYRLKNTEDVWDPAPDNAKRET